MRECNNSGKKLFVLWDANTRPQVQICQLELSEVQKAEPEEFKQALDFFKVLCIDYSKGKVSRAEMEVRKRKYVQTHKD